MTITRTKPLPRTRATPRTHRCPGCQERTSSSVCPTCKTRKATRRGNIGKRCDALWATWIKSGFKCFVCAKPDIEAAHIIGRAQRVVRWSTNPPNGIPLCHEHHRAFDSYKLDREALIISAIGETHYIELRRKALGIWDKTYPLAELTVLVKEAQR